MKWKLIANSRHKNKWVVPLFLNTKLSFQIIAIPIFHSLYQENTIMVIIVFVTWTFIRWPEGAMEVVMTSNYYKMSKTWPWNYFIGPKSLSDILCSIDLISSNGFHDVLFRFLHFFFPNMNFHDGLFKSFIFVFKHESMMVVAWVTGSIITLCVLEHQLHCGCQWLASIMKGVDMERSSSSQMLG